MDLNQPSDLGRNIVSCSDPFSVPHGGFQMYRFASLACVALAFLAFSGTAEEPTSQDAITLFRFVLQPNQQSDRLTAVPVDKNYKLAKNATIVTCTSLEFENNAIVFINATLESEGEHINATRVTVQLDRISGTNVAWKLSDDFKITPKTNEARKRLLKELGG
ncbi:hypothetical protein U8335_09475 [Roseiconus lacunae]|uniref:hypothetical protein n=1 Tax=Roseiconus lacunae TaxID=2605694 RepID=UPI00308DD515|nr:hypothetical protein U8335_09475 [Stieleria sp. HD01]